MSDVASVRLASDIDSVGTQGLWGQAWRRLLRNGPGLVGLVLILLFVLVALLAPLIAPSDPLRANLPETLQAPSVEHLMGTDLLGRDVLGRVVYGARISLLASVVSVIVGLVAGGIIGSIAGALGGRVDAVLMRIVDTLMAIPSVLLAIGIVATLGRGLPQIMFAVGIANAPVFARILRGTLLEVRTAEYVVAARSLGASELRLLLRHMLPNSLTPIVVAATLALATALIDVASLGFLGLGPPDPRTAEWGTMLTDSTQFLREAPWLIFFPAAALVLTAIGFNLLGDGLRASLDPRMKR